MFLTKEEIDFIEEHFFKEEEEIPCYGVGCRNCIFCLVVFMCKLQDHFGIKENVVFNIKDLVKKSTKNLLRRRNYKRVADYKRW